MTFHVPRASLLAGVAAPRGSSPLGPVTNYIYVIQNLFSLSSHISSVKELIDIHIEVVSNEAP